VVLLLARGSVRLIWNRRDLHQLFSQEASSVRFEWLGFGYVPLLRGTAVASVVLGGMLVRRGWSNP
jgi:hypothetical protein